ncbi:hypothetical protein ACU6TU_08200 [Halomonas sp. LS-001]
MIKYQKIAFIFPGKMIRLEIDAYPEINRYEYWIIDNDWTFTQVAIACSPTAALGHSFQTILRMATEMPKEIWVDPVEEFISTQETLCTLSRCNMWTKKVSYH